MNILRQIFIFFRSFVMSLASLNEISSLSLRSIIQKAFSTAITHQLIRSVNSHCAVQQNQSPLAFYLTNSIFIKYQLGGFLIALPRTLDYFNKYKNLTQFFTELTNRPFQLSNQITKFPSKISKSPSIQKRIYDRVYVDQNFQPQAQDSCFLIFLDSKVIENEYDSWIDTNYKCASDNGYCLCDVSIRQRRYST